MEQFSFSPEIETRDDLSWFIEQIALADGRLIELPGKQSRTNQTYSISARYGRRVDQPSDLTNYLNIDVFVQNEEGYEPIGMRDYMIINKIASGNSSYRFHYQNNAPYHLVADKKWKSCEGVFVERQHRRNEVGSLMTAAGLLVLQAKGVQKIKFELLTLGGEALWSKFGKEIGAEAEEVEKLVIHPFTREAIRPFVIKKD